MSALSRAMYLGSHRVQTSPCRFTRLGQSRQRTPCCSDVCWVIRSSFLRDFLLPARKKRCYRFPLVRWGLRAPEGEGQLFRWLESARNRRGRRAIRCPPDASPRTFVVRRLVSGHRQFCLDCHSPPHRPLLCRSNSCVELSLLLPAPLEKSPPSPLQKKPETTHLCCSWLLPQQ